MEQNGGVAHEEEQSSQPGSWEVYPLEHWTQVIQIWLNIVISCHQVVD